MGADSRKFPGLYKGVVVSNVDPYDYGRLQVSVEDLLGSVSTVWVEPSAPLAGMGSGAYVVPLEGSGVWVQFVNGDPDRPVWTGFWRGDSGDVPTAAQAAPPGTPQIVLGTPGQNVLLISDLPGPEGGIILQFASPGGAYIKLSAAGVELGATAAGPTIRITPALIDLGNGALQITGG